VRLVECVPNFSEGRRKEVVDEIVRAIESVEGITVLDVEMDPDHNRSVVTFVGEPEAVLEAAFRGVKRAAELIDMDQHRGAHPRFGAADVVPFVPVEGVSMTECVELAHRLGRRIGEELGIPVYLYDKAATREDRRVLSDIRNESFQYEQLKEAIGKDDRWIPDYGPRRLGKAGATIVGARDFLIAFNVNLGTDDVGVAKAIARAVRGKTGGLAYVRALGFPLRERGIAQVSMNLVNYKRSPIYRTFELVKMEAERYGVPVVESEIVGLVPMDALLDVAEFYLRLRRFRRDQVLEKRLWNLLKQGAGGDFVRELAGCPGLRGLACGEEDEEVVQGRGREQGEGYDRGLQEGVGGAPQGHGALGQGPGDGLCACREGPQECYIGRRHGDRASEIRCHGSLPERRNQL